MQEHVFEVNFVIIKQLIITLWINFKFIFKV